MVWILVQLCAEPAQEIDKGKGARRTCAEPAQKIDKGWSQDVPVQCQEYVNSVKLWGKTSKIWYFWCILLCIQETGYLHPHSGLPPPRTPRKITLLENRPRLDKVKRMLIMVTKSSEFLADKQGAIQRGKTNQRNNRSATSPSHPRV